MAIQVKKT